jgi:hypothetical protein
MRSINYKWQSCNGLRVTEMVYIEGTNDRPYSFGIAAATGKINVREFWIGTVPVTQTLWMHVMGSEDRPAVGQGAERPLENVSWDGLTVTGGFIERINAGAIRTRKRDCERRPSASRLRRNGNTRRVGDRIGVTDTAIAAVTTSTAWHGMIARAAIIRTT